MTIRRLLVLTLNPANPIPNAAAIRSHQPDSVLIIRVKPHKPVKEKLLDKSLERLLAWSEGSLLEHYGFRTDFRTELCPETPAKSPCFRVIEVERILHSGEQIRLAIEDDPEMRDANEIIIDVSTGRKEDSTSLARIYPTLSSEVAASVWYTDTTSGISVEVGGSLIKSEKHPLSQIDKLWMNGYPVVGVNSILSGMELRRTGLLTPTLDAIEETLSSKERTTQESLLEALESRGIEAEGIWLNENQKYPVVYQLRRLGQLDWSQSIRIPGKILKPRDGSWLEYLTGMAIAESWDCEEIFVGLQISDPSHNGRMARIKSALYRMDSGWKLSNLWTGCNKLGLIPPTFRTGEKDEDGEPVMFDKSRLDFLDNEVFDIGEFRPSYRDRKDTEKLAEYNCGKFRTEIRSFVKWVITVWDNLPLEIRLPLIENSRSRELDVLVETNSHCLFIECKLSSSAKQNIKAKSQVDSIIASAGSRGKDFSILSHNELDQDQWRGGDFQFIVPWNMLRRPEELLSSVISSQTVPEFFPGRVRHPRGSYHRRRKSKLETEVHNSQGKMSNGTPTLDWEPTPASEKPPEFKGGEFPPRARFYCPVEDCMETFPKHSLLVGHIRDTGHNGYKCEECGDICHSNKSVKKHAGRNPGHLSFSGKCYRIADLKLPITPHQESLDALDADGFYESAIQKSLTSSEVAKGIEKATGKVWRDVFATSPTIKIYTYFNERDTGKILFIQNDSGSWVATEPEPSDGE